uniref:Uncharacterized protein n=1 Tax=Gasterosteus aculeatus TaxID=69293 RepID=G3P6V2_GASAC
MPGSQCSLCSLWHSSPVGQASQHPHNNNSSSSSSSSSLHGFAALQQAGSHSSPIQIKLQTAELALAFP